MNRYHYNRSDFEDDGATPARFVRLMIDAALAICILLLILAFVQNRDLEDKVANQQQEVSRYAGLLAECLNGGAMLDRESNVAYFCGKPSEVRL